MQQGSVPSGYQTIVLSGGFGSTITAASSNPSVQVNVVPLYTLNDPHQNGTTQGDPQPNNDSSFYRISLTSAAGQLSPGTYTFTVTLSETYTLQTTAPGGVAAYNYTSSNDSTIVTINLEVDPPSYPLTLGTQGSGLISANPSNVGSVYPAGTQVTITAIPAVGWVFTGFTGSVNSSTNPLTVTINGPTNITANFQPYPQITITSNPTGLNVLVDCPILPLNCTYTTPHVFQWNPNSPHTVNLTGTQNPSGDTRAVFNNWSDGLAMSHQVTAPAAGGSLTLTANFDLWYLLTLNPGPGGTIQTNPVHSDLYYAAGSQVQLTASPNGGYSFAQFQEDLRGTTNPQTLTMSGPRRVTAVFQPLQPVHGIAVTSSGLVYNRIAGTGSVTFTLTNNSPAAVPGPIQLVLTQIPSGVTAVHPTGTYQGNPYWTVSDPVSLNPGASAQVTVQLSYAAGTVVTTVPVIYSGVL
jgi:hypothetical protein